MPTYEYLCRDCGERFDLQRPMSRASAVAVCPQGHGDTVKLLSTVALAGRAASAGNVGTGGGGSAASSGGCCGGSCGCGG